jgi:hypothetical protein
MTVFPVVPDFEKYPDYGRDIDLALGEIGLTGHWMKYLLHHAFIYQAKIKPGGSFMPDSFTKNSLELYMSEKIIHKEPYQQAYYLPATTGLTRYMRTSLIWQGIRFILINLKFTN